MYKEDDSEGPCITVYFPEHKTPIQLPVSKVRIVLTIIILNQFCIVPYHKHREVSMRFEVTNLQQIFVAIL